MRRLVHTAVLLCLLSPSLPAQEVRLPPEVKGPVGLPIKIVALHIDGGEPRWKVGDGLVILDATSIFDFPPDLKVVQKGVVVYGAKNGTYEAWSWNAKGDKASAISVCKVVVGTGVPDVPVPTPTPPGPTPPIPPGPVPPTPPTPIAAPIDLPGLAVLIIEESKDRRDSLPPEVRNYLWSTEDFHALLREKTIKAPDGKSAWRIWDQNDIVTGAAPYWQKAFARPRTSVPWMIVSNPRKGGGWEGPLPMTKEGIRAKVLQFAE